ncbi:hypothetical protein EV696_12524 [Permianibacter aggregans]|uniref:Uncharacterized protein n=1 Tax=Permianibacter aggregans TaxID=1510150 RepID=A0A4R6UG81_9GAMM|nr:hypothetical protein EV696_12524 [Permianibacter aggregans]
MRCSEKFAGSEFSCNPKGEPHGCGEQSLFTTCKLRFLRPYSRTSLSPGLFLRWLLEIAGNKKPDHRRNDVPVLLFRHPNQRALRLTSWLVAAANPVAT